MKKITKYIPTIILTLLCSCSDYLDIVPDNVTTLDIVFNNRNTAERYLANCYHLFQTMDLSNEFPAWEPDTNVGSILLMTLTLTMKSAFI